MVTCKATVRPKITCEVGFRLCICERVNITESVQRLAMDLRVQAVKQIIAGDCDEYAEETLQRFGPQSGGVRQ